MHVIFVPVIQSEKQAVGFFPSFAHALEVFWAAIPGRQSLHQYPILCTACRGSYGGLMTALEPDTPASPGLRSK